MSDSLQPQFAEVLTLIKTAQQKVIATANQELIELYRRIGEYISDQRSFSRQNHDRSATIKTLDNHLPEQQQLDIFE